ncbi:PadR family transcriptional regulator [Lactococcus garvieae]|jgi:PadR family transcriptional regulator PadR|uniref:PadR family transcriptional regulator n=1 Tax=Lactococcus garvieae TaxID=1363 RepID=UPI0018D9E654|nr:PadR family transcriptional regulator [Lactococcus garvieae]QPS70336.1 helix-turn-helix transcriptional regulator [Lactococcus garvieae]
MENNTEMLKGVLEGCVMQIISQGETYGYAITQKLKEQGFTDVVEGTVYTITSRLERQKLLETEKKASEKGPARKFFKLNEAGEKELEAFWTRWDFISDKLSEIRRLQ